MSVLSDSYILPIPETLCMKGLVQTHLGKRDEGLEAVKKGVRLDLTSHIVWHVFGLIQKGEKNYEEALKSYTQALRFDKVRHASCYLPQKFLSQRSHCAFLACKSTSEHVDIMR